MKKVLFSKANKIKREHRIQSRLRIKRSLFQPNNRREIYNSRSPREDDLSVGSLVLDVARMCVHICVCACVRVCVCVCVCVHTRKDQSSR